MSSQKIRSQKHVKKQQKRRRRQFVALIVAILLLLGGLIGLTHWSAVEITSFEVSINSSLPEEEIKDVVSSQLDRRLWFVVAQDNILLLPSDLITDKVANLTPRIKSADITRTGLQRFNVSVQTRSPSAQVCPPKPATSSRCLLVDKNGFAYRRADMKNSSSSELFMYRSSNLPEVGSQLKAPETFRVLQSFITKLPELSFAPESAMLKDHEDVYIETADGSGATSSSSTSVQLRVNLADDLSRKFTDLQTIVENKSFVASTTEETPDGTTPSISPFALEYIDLRFGNKVFYK